MKFQAFLETLGLMRTRERVRDGLRKDQDVVGLEKDLDHRETESRVRVKLSSLFVPREPRKRWNESSDFWKNIEIRGSRVDST